VAAVLVGHLGSRHYAASRVKTLWRVGLSGTFDHIAGEVDMLVDGPPIYFGWSVAP